METDECIGCPWEMVKTGSTGHGFGDTGAAQLAYYVFGFLRDPEISLVPYPCLHLQMLFTSLSCA